MKLSTKEPKLGLKRVIKRKDIDLTTIFILEAILKKKKKLGDIPYNLDNANEYNHIYLVMDDTACMDITNQKQPCGMANSPWTIQNN